MLTCVRVRYPLIQIFAASLRLPILHGPTPTLYYTHPFSIALLIMSLARVWSRAASVAAAAPGTVSMRAATLMRAGFTSHHPTPLTARTTQQHHRMSTLFATIGGMRCVSTTSHPQWLKSLSSNGVASTNGDSIDPTIWGPNVGVFGCPFKQPSDFKRLEKEVRERCNTLISLIDRTPPSLHHLSLTDAISNVLCSVIDIAEACKNVHPSPEFREAAAECSAELGAYMAELNHSPILYHSITSLSKLPDFKSWSSESQRVQMLLQRDMDSQGIGLTSEERLKVTDLLAQIHQHTFDFSTAHFGEADHHDTLNVTVPTVHAHGGVGGSRMITPLRKKGEVWTYPMAYAVTLLQTLPTSAMRREVYLQYHSNTSECTKVQRSSLIGMVTSRQRFAAHLGATSFASHTVANCVAADATHVRRVLISLLEQLSPEKNVKTFEELRSMKCEKWKLEGKGGSKKSVKKVDGGKTISINGEKFTEEQVREIDSTLIEPWDVSYYQSHVRSKLIDQTKVHGLAHYFSVKNVLEGYRILTQRLFGLELIQNQLELEESWLDTSKLEHQDELLRLEIWQPSTEKTPERTLLGVIYLDLYSRPNKFSNAASFGFRSGCQTLTGHPEWKESRRQIPVVAIVCALSRPTWKSAVHVSQQRTLDETKKKRFGLSSFSSSSIDHAKNEITLLSHQDVEMLFHEFGHCLHNILSSTTYQHVAGARGELDFVEMPSTFFENFISEYEFVSQWSRHYSTNQVLPQELFREMIQAKHAFTNTELINQALMSLFDQEIHGSELTKLLVAVVQEGQDPSSSSEEEISEKIGEIHHQIRMKYSPFYHKDSPKTYNYYRLFHLTNYAASYYCYLYCRIFSSILWSRYFAKSPLDRSLGDKLRHQLFQYGGGKDPREILAELADVPTNQTLQQFVEEQITTFIKAHGKTTTTTTTSAANDST